ncbi:MAG: hypothetical protein V3T83_18135 [Acidobacteriota bacterium]
MTGIAKSFAAMLGLFGILLGCRPDPQPAESVSSEPETPFKLAQYQAGQSMRMAMLVGGRLHDLHRLNATVPPAGQGAMPGDMLELIAGYQDLKPRLYQLANYIGQHPQSPHLAPVDLSDGGGRLLAPLLYP